MTHEANRVEIKVTQLFTHHRMLQCFSCVSDQSVAEVTKTNQVVLSQTAVQRSLSSPAVYAQQASKIWDQVMGGLRCQIKLCLENASLYREADQWMPREEPVDASCA